MKNKLKNSFLSLTFVVCLASASSAQSNTAYWSIGNAAMLDIQCINFMVTGVCIWLSIYGFAIEIDYSIKYGHFNPDLVVEVTRPEGSSNAEGQKRIDTHNRDHANKHYNESFAYAHPLTGQIYCPSQTSALTPHYSSVLDHDEWTSGRIEGFYPQTWMPFSNLIGRMLGPIPINYWGNEYPRTGWNIQYNPPKAAAVIMQRTGSIVTGSALRIYNPISGEADDGDYYVEEPEQLEINTNSEGWFQWVYPERENGCIVFGKNDSLQLQEWGGDKHSVDRTYASVLYRPYECCSVEGMILIAPISVISYPPPHTD